MWCCDHRSSDFLESCFPVRQPPFLFSFPKGREENILHSIIKPPSSNKHWTGDRTFIACVAFSLTLSPSCKPGRAASVPFAPLTPEQGSIFQSDRSNSAVLQVASRSRNARFPWPHASAQCRSALTLLRLSKAHTAACRHFQGSQRLQRGLTNPPASQMSPSSPLPTVLGLQVLREHFFFFKVPTL